MRDIQWRGVEWASLGAMRAEAGRRGRRYETMAVKDEGGRLAKGCAEKGEGQLVRR